MTDLRCSTVSLTHTGLVRSARAPVASLSATMVSSAVNRSPSAR